MSAHVYPSIFWIISCIHVKNIINISPAIIWKFLTMDEINVNFLTALKKQRKGNMDTRNFSVFSEIVYIIFHSSMCLCRELLKIIILEHRLYHFGLLYYPCSEFFSPCGRKNEKTYKVNPTYQRSLQRLLVHGWVVYHFIQFLFFHSSSYFILCPFLLWGYAKLFCWVIW